MAITPDIRAPQGYVLATVRQSTPHLRADQSVWLAPYNVPSKDIKATNAYFSLVERKQATGIDVTQAATLGVARGRVQQPQVRVFTFTLDGHDFYAVRLGDQGTLLYDTASEQWIDWNTKDLQFWRLNDAINWVGNQSEGFRLQSYTDIVAGDDTWGVLYFLDPTQPWDDHPDYLNEIQQVDFPRVVMAQKLASGRQYMPCYAIFLDGDNYGLTADDFVPSILLETSDDQGRTWEDQGTLTVIPEYNVNNPYEWLSLGQISSPGRLFRVTDNGLFTRIDTMSMNDDG